MIFATGWRASDLIAEAVERIRYRFGHYKEWTSLPAPLFFERVVRDHVSHFAIKEAEVAEAEKGDEEYEA